MDIFKSTGNKFSGAIKNLQKKTNDSIAERKLQAQIKDAQDEITKLYRSIGEVYYSHVKGASDESLKELCAGIDTLNERIEELREEIDALRDVKRCTECGEEVGEGVRFCPACGARQVPKQEEPERAPESPESEKCPECGRERKEGARFCEGCGHSFAPVKEAPAEESEEPEAQEEE